MSDSGTAPPRAGGSFDGRDLGGSVSVILVSTDEPGAGRRAAVIETEWLEES